MPPPVFTRSLALSFPLNFVPLPQRRKRLVRATAPCMERSGEMLVSVVTDGEIICVDKATFTYISGAIPTGLAPDIVPQSAGGRVSIIGQGFLKHQQTRVRLCPVSGEHWKGDIHAHAEAATKHIGRAEAVRVAKEREELRRFMADGGEIKHPDEEAWWKKKRRATRAGGGSGTEDANYIPIASPPDGNSSVGPAPPRAPNHSRSHHGFGQPQCCGKAEHRCGRKTWR